MPEQLSFQATIETPELVGLQFELAGIGTRSAAYLTDFTLRMLVLVLVILLISLLGSSFHFVNWWLSKDSGWLISILILFYYAQEWLYHTLLEWLWGGRTAGKKLLGIRVIKESGRPIDFVDSCLRNLCRPIDTMLPLTLVGVLFMFFNRRHQRPGDLMAGTLVVQEHNFDLAKNSSFSSSPETLNPFLEIVVGLHLNTTDIDAAQRFLSRRNNLDNNLRVKFAIELATGIWENANPNISPPWHDSSQVEDFLLAVATRR